MIQSQTVLRVIDNSGARTARCIKVLGGSFTRTGSVGSLVVVSVQKVRKNQKKTKMKRGEVFLGVVVQVKKKIGRPDGHFLTFGSNAVILLNQQKKPVASRILGPVTRELRTRQFLKVGLMSSGIL